MTAPRVEDNPLPTTVCPACKVAVTIDRVATQCPCHECGRMIDVPLFVRAFLKTFCGKEGNIYGEVHESETPPHLAAAMETIRQHAGDRPVQMHVGPDKRKDDN
jgi:hypothetical protein